MSFTKTDSSINKKRIIYFAGTFRYSNCTCMSKPVITTYNKCIKCIFLIKIWLFIFNFFIIGNFFFFLTWLIKLVFGNKRNIILVIKASSQCFIYWNLKRSVKLLIYNKNRLRKFFRCNYIYGVVFYFSDFKRINPCIILNILNFIFYSYWFFYFIPLKY